MRHDWQLDRQAGSAGLLALLMMTLLLVLGGALIALSSTEMDISRDYRNGIAAEYLAEAGVQWAIVKLKLKNDFVTLPGNSFTSQQKNSGTATAGTFTVEVSNSWNVYTIKATGIVGNNDKNARRLNVLKVTPWGVYSFPAYSDTSVTIGNSSKIWQGTIGSKGSIDNKGYVQGEIQPDLNNFIFPAGNETDYSNAAALPLVINSDETFDGLSGLYYVNGDFVIDGNIATAANSAASIFVKGKATINDDAHITGKLRIIAANEVEVSGYVNRAILIACGAGSSVIKNSAELYGSIISRGNLIIHGTVIYDKEVILAFLPYLGSTFTINSYSNY